MEIKVWGHVAKDVTDFKSQLEDSFKDGILKAWFFKTRKLAREYNRDGYKVVRMSIVI